MNAMVPVASAPAHRCRSCGYAQDEMHGEIVTFATSRLAFPLPSEMLQILVLSALPRPRWLRMVPMFIPGARHTLLTTGALPSRLRFLSLLDP